MARSRPGVWLLLLVLLVSETGCASRGRAPAYRPSLEGPELAWIMALGPTGVRLSQAPDRHLVEPPSGWWIGAWRGAVAGAAATAVGGFMVGAAPLQAGCGGDCRIVGAWFLTFTAAGLALTPAGAVVGSVVGMVKTPPAGQTRQAHDTLVGALAAADPARALHDRVVALAGRRSAHAVVALADAGPGATSMGTILEIVVRHVGLDKSPAPLTDFDPTFGVLDTDPQLELRLQVDVWLLRAHDGEVLYADSFEQTGSAWPFSLWAADEGRAQRDSVGITAEAMADRIVRAVFGAPKPPEEPGFAPLAGFLYVAPAL